MRKTALPLASIALACLLASGVGGAPLQSKNGTSPIWATTETTTRSTYQPR